MGELGRGRQLAATLAILVATGAALALTGTGRDEAAATPPAADAALDPEELVRLSVDATPEVARRVAQLRALGFETIPQPEAITGAELSELERRELARTGGSGGIAADEATVRILGLLEPSEQLEDAVAASDDLAAAAYDTRADRLYVVSDAVSADSALVEFLLSHELTHALEDQHFGLSDPNAAANDDDALARLALTEGTATAMMVDYARRHMDPLELGAATAGIDASTGDVPEFVVGQLEWAYLGGMEFVNELREIAGGWKLVDYALEARPPASTEQVLHPEKYIRDERPVPMTINQSALEGHGWRLADRGVAGELATRQLLELGGDDDLAERAATGWAGDRYELWWGATPPAGCPGTCREDLVLVLRWRMDSTADAGELARAIPVYVEDGLGGSDPGRGAWSIEGGSVASARAGRDVALAFAPDAELARAIASTQDAGATADPPD